MNDLTDQLDAIQARLEGDRSYFDGPGYIGETDQCIEDREFLLVLARKQQAAIDAVKGLHTEDLFRGHLSNGCRICGGGAGWPCPTIEALEAKP